MRADVELLRCFADHRSEESFSELVERHLNLVYSVAIRQCGGDAHLAKDVSQQVFTALARKAPGLTRLPVLSGWLYRAAQFAASDAVRAERRRRVREKEAQAMQERDATPVGNQDWERLRPLLDRAMAELSDRDRDAIVLRFIEKPPPGPTP
jgi:RNA polymerase sigma factor (sigma-70 family)